MRRRVGDGERDIAAANDRKTTYSWAPGVCTAGGVKEAKLSGVSSPGVKLSPGLCSADDGIARSGKGSERVSREGGVGGRK